mgnify:CR=1 FL=1
MTEPGDADVFQDRFLELLSAIEAYDAQGLAGIKSLRTVLLDLRDVLLSSAVHSRTMNHPNPLARSGRQCFSQSDEDGITLEILRRIGRIDSGVFAEFGVGNGLQNNTLILGALGWNGIWVGDEDLAFDVSETSPDRLNFQQERITRDNIVGLARSGLAALHAKSADVISCDLDGNDLHFIGPLLESGLRPSLFIVEYNAKFPPPVRFAVAYDADHRWQGDDYYGASLCSLTDLFERFGYMLVCCNPHTGTNAFFVAERHREHFGDVPGDVADIYVAPHQHMLNRYAHRTSARTVREMFRGTAP